MEETKTSKTAIAGLVISIIAVLMSAFVLTVAIATDSKPIKSLINPDPVVETQISDSDFVSEPVTIDEVLQFRRDIKEQLRNDSIFMNIPDVALIAILMKGGTDMSNGDIAREYITHRKDYDNVEFGAQISAMHRHNTEPDTIPKHSKPDSVSDFSD